MIGRFFIFFSLFIALAFSGRSQSVLRAKRHLEKDNLERVIKIIEQSVRKSASDPANYFMLALYYIHPDFGFEAIDSANRYINLAVVGWETLDEKEQKKYSRKGMDSLSIVSLSLKIDSLAFENAKILNTEQSYNHFIDNYSGAFQKQEAMEQRNIVAYQDAVAINSPEAMEQFFRNYPDAKQAKNAKDIYETLYYERFTESGSLVSYEKYLSEQPESILKEEAALQFLKIISTGADSSLLQSFIQTYPNTHAGRTASYLLSYWKNGDLLNPLLVHFKSGKYYFFDIVKQKLLNFNLSVLEMDSCSWVTSAIIASDSKDKWFDRSGNLWLNEQVSAVEYLQSGFFKVSYPTKLEATLIHISKDSVLTQKATDFRKIDSYFLSKKVGKKWQLLSLLGEEILSQPVDSIWTENKIYFFKNNDRMALANRSGLIKNGINDFKTLSLLYTDYHLHENGSIWLASNEYQSVLSADLKPMIPLKKVIISKIPLGWIVQNDAELTILTNDFKGKMSLEAKEFKSNTQQIALKNNNKWALISPQASFPEFEYDSVRLFSSWLSYVEVGEKRELIFNSGVHVILEKGESFKVLKTYNEAVINSGSEFRFVEIANKKGYLQIYNGLGRKVEEGDGIKVDALTADILQVSLKDKKILIDSAGNKLFDEKVDAFGSMQEGLIPVLKNKKFGAFQISNRLVIPFKSDIKIQVFVPDSLFIFQKDGKYGIMDTLGKQVLENNYNSILYLNDSMAFVEIENRKSLLHIYSKEEIIEGIKLIEKVAFGKTDFYLIRLSTGYGIINSAAQELLPFIFNAIEPITYSNKLLWKAERRIVEMDYQVVAYFDANGELLFREGFTNEEYLKTACD